VAIILKKMFFSIHLTILIYVANNSYASQIFKYIIEHIPEKNRISALTVTRALLLLEIGRSIIADTLRQRFISARSPTARRNSIDTRSSSNTALASIIS